MGVHEITREQEEKSKEGQTLNSGMKGNPKGD